MEVDELNNKVVSLIRKHTNVCVLLLYRNSCLLHVYVYVCVFVVIKVGRCKQYCSLCRLSLEITIKMDTLLTKTMQMYPILNRKVRSISS